MSLVFEETTPHAYRSIVEHLSDVSTNVSRNGDTKEELGVVVRSHDPRTRWMFRPDINWAFGLQESYAYWAGKNPGHVQRYNSKMEEFMYDGELHGSAYGRYLRHIPHDQIGRVIGQLQQNEETRRAVINIHQAGVEDYDKGDVACTVYLQFIARDDELNMITSMRSQDMLWGYPYDVQAFQWIQEVIAGVLDLDLGFYEHRMNSCHYYTDFEDSVKESWRRSSVHSLPDCRLDSHALSTVMNRMDKGLQRARDGEIPYKEIKLVDRQSEFYADWLQTMTAYEQLRFHGDKKAAFDLKKGIETTPMALSINRRL